MKNTINALTLVFFLLGCLPALAGEPAGDGVYLRTEQESMKIFAPKEGALSLEEVKELAAGENVDIRLAYENLYRAHQKINSARAAYFPYGAGDLAAIYVFNFWNPLILAELGTSIPSKWHNVAKQKHLKQAEAHRLESLKANLKNQAAKLYYGVLKEEAVLELVGLEVRLLEKLARVLEKQIRTGLARYSELEEVEHQALKTRDRYLRLKSYLAEEKAAMRVLLNKRHDSRPLAFAPVRKRLPPEDLEFDIETLTKGALERSRELKAAEQTLYATYRAKRSERWSILSFTGLGFDYMERVRFAGSKVEQARLQKEALKRNIENEVGLRASVLENAARMARSEAQLANASRKYMASELALHQTGSNASNELIMADIYYLRDFRAQVIAHYNVLTKLDDLERAVLDKVIKQKK